MMIAKSGKMKMKMKKSHTSCNFSPRSPTVGFPCQFFLKKIVPFLSQFYGHY